MLCTYRLKINAVCPVDGSPDVYEAELTSGSEIRVEKIIEAAAQHSAVAMTQEELTAKLARDLGCGVRTEGWHSGIKTIVSVP